MRPIEAFRLVQPTTAIRTFNNSLGASAKILLCCKTEDLHPHPTHQPEPVPISLAFCQHPFSGKQDRPSTSPALCTLVV